MVAATLAVGAILSTLMAVEGRAPGYLATLIFLAFCALIVVLQLAPLFRNLWKRSAARKLEQAEAVVKHHEKLTQKEESP